MTTQSIVQHLGAWPTGRGPLQQKLAHALMHAIRHGSLNPGLRLPSERALASALRISRTTVVAAYDALRERGWLESRSGSGTWVSARSPVVMAARGSAQALVLAESPLLGLLARESDLDMLDFALGTPDALDGLPSELFVLPADELASMMQNRLYYPFGMPALRAAIAAEYSRIGLDTRPEQVLVTNGGQHAIALCAMLCLQRGDTVLLEDPAYFGALDVYRTIGARVSSLPVGAHGVSPSVIRDRITATAARLVYLTPSFQNPTGVVMPGAARKELGRVATEIGVPIIDDRTMADLYLEGPAPAPLAAYAPKAPVLTIGSLSKLVWPGLRVGWIRAAEPTIERLARLKSALDLASPLVTQAIAVRLLAVIDQARERRRRQLKPRRDLLVELVRKRLPDWSFRVPSGGLFLWARLPDGDARELAQVALRHRIVTLPGSTMSAAEAHTDSMRLPFLAEPAILRAGVDRLSAAWKDYRSSSRNRQQAVPIL